MIFHLTTTSANRKRKMELIEALTRGGGSPRALWGYWHRSSKQALRIDSDKPADIGIVYTDALPVYPH